MEKKDYILSDIYSKKVYERRLDDYHKLIILNSGSNNFECPKLKELGDTICREYDHGPAVLSKNYPRYLSKRFERTIGDYL